MRDPELFQKIEASLSRRSTPVFQKVDLRVEQAIAARERHAAASGTLYTHVCDILQRQNRFIKKSGKLDEPGFYAYARIDKTTWSNLRWNLRVPSKETLLKLIFALRLNEAEARALMARGSNSLNEADPRDRIVLALLDVGCYEIESVYEVLEEYGTRGAVPFRNIYADVRQ